MIMATNNMASRWDAGRSAEKFAEAYQAIRTAVAENRPPGEPRRPSGGDGPPMSEPRP